MQRQTLRNQIEFLVVDGGSTDGTLDSLQAKAQAGHVDSWVSEPDQGIYDAMNKAVRLARGSYVLFLNAGDVFPASDTVARLFEGVDGRPGYLWGDCEIVRGDRVLADPAPRMRRFLYRQMTVCHQSLAVRTDLLCSHPFDVELRVAADYEVLCALVTEGQSGVYRAVTVSRVLDEGFSSRNFFLGLAEKRHISRRYFPREQWRAEPYFLLWGWYMKWKLWTKEKS